MSENVTHNMQTDGFGSQYNAMIYAVLYSELAGLDYYYSPIVRMEHNYEAYKEPDSIKRRKMEIDFITTMEDFINMKPHFKNVYPGLKYRELVHIWERHNVIHAVELDKLNIFESPGFKKIKSCFWEKKIKPKYDYLSVGVHIRRRNQHDCREHGTLTPDDYYLFMIDYLRKKYSGRKIIFNIYSQGDKEKFEKYKAEDTILHLDEPLIDTFMGLACADVLVTSQSAFSHTASLMSDAEVYYVPSRIDFHNDIWANPKQWINGWELFKHR